MSLFIYLFVIYYMNDIDYVKKYLNWDTDSFWFLYDKYIDLIYKFVYLKTSNTEATEDIVSDVFFSALNNINTFRVDVNSSFKSWIYKIAYNKIIDYYKYSEKYKVSDIWDYMDLSNNINIWLNIDNKEKLMKVLSFIKWLKIEHRDILIYRLWNDLSFKEISEITGYSLDNCKKINSRTLKIINEKFINLLILIIIL